MAKGTLIMTTKSPPKEGGDETQQEDEAERSEEGGGGRDTNTNDGSSGRSSHSDATSSTEAVVGNDDIGNGRQRGTVGGGSTTEEAGGGRRQGEDSSRLPPPLANPRQREEEGTAAVVMTAVTGDKSSTVTKKNTVVGPTTPAVTTTNTNKTTGDATTTTTTTTTTLVGGDGNDKVYVSVRERARLLALADARKTTAAVIGATSTISGVAVAGGDEGRKRAQDFSREAAASSGKGGEGVGDVMDTVEGLAEDTMVTTSMNDESSPLIGGGETGRGGGDGTDGNDESRGKKKSEEPQSSPTRKKKGSSWVAIKLHSFNAIGGEVSEDTVPHRVVDDKKNGEKAGGMEDEESSDVHKASTNEIRGAMTTSFSVDDTATYYSVNTSAATKRGIHGYNRGLRHGNSNRGGGDDPSVFSQDTTVIMSNQKDGTVELELSPQRKAKKAAELLAASSSILEEEEGDTAAVPAAAAAAAAAAVVVTTTTSGGTATGGGDDVPVQEQQAAPAQEEHDAAQTQEEQEGETTPERLQRNTLRALMVIDEEDDIVLYPPSTPTYGRKVATFLAKKFSWYYPAGHRTSDVHGTTNPPSLDAAWAYFEHVTLPRHFVCTGVASSASSAAATPSTSTSRAERGFGGVGENGNANAPEPTPSSSSLHLIGGGGSAPGGEDDDSENELPHEQQLELMRQRTSLSCEGEGGEKSESASPIGTEQPRGDGSIAMDTTTATTSRGFMMGDNGGDKMKNMNKTRGLLFKKRDKLEKAEPGESDVATELYRVWKTPEKELADFGIGVGLYFNTLRVFTGLFFVAGLLSIPNINYFRSTKYTNDGQASVRPVLRGSAICTNQVWRACPTCAVQDWKDLDPNTGRYAQAVGNGGETLHFILQNECPIGLGQGLGSWFVLVFMFVSILGVGYFYQKRKAVKLDEIQQTTTDYSIEVTNPPADAYDPEEWRDFFLSRFPYAHVTCCTVVVDNEVLINAMAERRKLLLQLENMLPPDTTFDKTDLNGVVSSIPAPPEWQASLHKLLRVDAESVLRKILKATQRIEGMMRRGKYDVSRVFVTFETEETQRAVLSTMSVAKKAIRKNDVSALPEPRYAFRNFCVLGIREPDEPSSIRWQDLDESPTTRLLQYAFTFGCTIFAIVVGALLIAGARRRGPGFAGFLISVLNFVVPMLCTTLSNLESHETEGRMQASQYCKVCLFRWTNTAIVVSIITPFTSSLGTSEDSLMTSIYGIFIAEIITTPILQLADISGNFSRHILGPRALDQRRMNLCFQGTAYELAERYTNITKVLFFCFYYVTLYPGAYFFTAATLLIHYFLDKFSLLRSWAQAPLINTQVAEFSRKSFFPIVLLTLAIMANYQWSGFPYDNACQSVGSSASQSYVGDHDAYTLGGEEVQVGISNGSPEFKFCNQNMFSYKPSAFPALPRFQPIGGEWMTSEQMTVVRLFGWTAMIILALIIYSFVSRIMDTFVWAHFKSSYKPSGRVGGRNFSEVTEIFAYVPQVKVPGFVYPLLACDISMIDPELVGWSSTNYDKYNLIYDVPVPSSLTRLRGEGSSGQPNAGSPLFSIVREWPPERTRGFLSTDSNDGHGCNDNDVNCPPPPGVA